MTKRDSKAALVRDLARRAPKSGMHPWTIISEHADLIHRARALVRAEKASKKRGSK